MGTTTLDAWGARWPGTWLGAGLLAGALCAGQQAFAAGDSPRAADAASTTFTATVPTPPAASSKKAAAGPADWVWQLPADVAPPRVPADNPMSTAKVELGRFLFYDKRLSGNGTQSCGSCHFQRLAFTDGRAHGLGSTGEAHPRSPMSLANVAFNATYTWANPALITLERQMTNPVFGETPVEMGVNDANVQQVLQRLQAEPSYPRRFAAAFPEDPQGAISWDHVIKAVSAFERSLLSFNSKYDRVKEGKARFSAPEARGLKLFRQAECVKCHQEPNFSNQFLTVATRDVDVSFYNKGLYNLDGRGAYPAASPGLIEITGKAADMGHYRAPTLRNIEVTAPYMHDGSVATLQEAIALYADGGRRLTQGPNAGEGRASPLKSALVHPRALSRQDQADLLAFLKTLTDPQFLRDPRHADPFQSPPPGKRRTP